MPKLFRPSYTKIVNGVKVTKQNAKWYCKMKVNGKWKPVPLAVNKRAAEIMYGNLLKDAELGRLGAVDPCAASATVPLVQHAANYAAHLKQRGSGVEHITDVRQYLAASFAGQFPGDVKPATLTQHLASRRAGGIGARRHNWEVGTLRSFFAWMVRTKRIGESPATELGRINEKADRRLIRRPLTEAECDRLILAADASTKEVRGMTGPMRATLYTVALATGFRCGELASLTGRSFDLDGQPPTVTLDAKWSKNGKEAIQPLPDWAVATLRRDGTMPAGRLFPGTWNEKAAKMLRIDLEVAGIPAVLDGLTVDFHSLRHTYIAGLKRAGVRLDDAMKLARHSDPKLTLAIYGQSSMVDLGAAVNRLSHGHRHSQAKLPNDDCTGQKITKSSNSEPAVNDGIELERKGDMPKEKPTTEVKPVGIEPTTRRLKVCDTSVEIACSSSDERDPPILALPRALPSPDPRRAAILAAYDAGDERVRAALYDLAVGGKGKVAA